MIFLLFFPPVASLRRSRAAEQRDELATPHSITSSARASSIGGTLRPSVPSTNIRLHPVVEHPGDV
jgi:hypothetical protein